MCSNNLQGTQVKETGRYLHASDLLLFLQETIPLGFHQCQLIAEKDEQILDLTLLLAPLEL